MDFDEHAEMHRMRLRSFCDNGFNGSHAEAASVLGRDTADIDGMLVGEPPIDEDLEMKMNGIAQERGIPIDATGGNAENA